VLNISWWQPTVPSSLPTAYKQRIRILTFKNFNLSKFWMAYHNCAVLFGCRRPDPLATLSYGTKSISFATKELTLSVGSTDKQIVTTSVTIRNYSASVETQRFLRTDLVNSYNNIKFLEESTCWNNDIWYTHTCFPLGRWKDNVLLPQSVTQSISAWSVLPKEIVFKWREEIKLALHK
jgi:hypothetical protein